MTPERRGRLIELTLVGLGVMGLASQSGVKLAIINETASLPRGVYVRVIGGQPRPGSIVALAPPPTAQAYLRALGAPSSALLLKRVAAAEGDLVCAEASHVRLPGRTVVAPTHDRRGELLPRWKGCALLGPGEVFLLGDTAASFDGRYFGPVPTADLAGVFWAIATW